MVGSVITNSCIYVSKNITIYSSLSYSVGLYPQRHVQGPAYSVLFEGAIKSYLTQLTYGKTGLPKDEYGREVHLKLFTLMVCKRV